MLLDIVQCCRVLLLALVLACYGASQAHAERRVALVVGNSNYVNSRTLPNALNDARIIAIFLKGIGFDVVERTNLTYKDLRDAIRDFGRSAAGADFAVVYFAGHGLEASGNNYLVPVDAKLASSSDLEYEAVTLSAVVDAVRGTKRLSLIILDACRNNPLAEKMVLQAGAKRSVQRGLARVEPKGDLLVAFAANAGTVARDGVGVNSPYAEALVHYLSAPGVDIRLALGGVRDAVRVATNNEQEPVIYGSLGGNVVPLVPGAPGPASVGPSKEQEAKIAWDAAKDYCSVAELKLFVARFGGTFFGDLAGKRIGEIEKKAVCALAAADSSDGDIVRRVQTELYRAGCLSAAPDGVWGARTIAALKAFALHAKLSHSPVEATEDVLDDLVQTKGRVCPVQCASDERVQSERCVKIERTAIPAPQLKARPPDGEASAPSTAAPRAAPAFSGSCESARSACAQLRSQCMRACHDKFGDRTYGDCSSCITSYPICVSKAAAGCK